MRCKSKTLNTLPKILIANALVGLLAVGPFAAVPQASAAPPQESNYAPPHIERQIQTSSDDARQTGLFGGSLSLTAHNLFMGDFGSIPQYIGLRFTSITIPEGSIITQAFLTFTALGDSSGATTLLIHGHDVDHSPTFSTGNGPLDRQTEFTSAEGTWSPEEWSDGIVYACVDISPIIQEIVDRPDWYPGNAISLIISDGDGINNVIRQAVAWDLNPSQAAEITIAFSEPTPTPPPLGIASDCGTPAVTNLLNQTPAVQLFDGSPSRCEVENEGADTPEGIDESEPDLCLISPKCVVGSALTGGILFILGGSAGLSLASRMGISKKGMVLFVMDSGVIGGGIGVGAVRGITLVGTDIPAEATLPHEEVVDISSPSLVMENVEILFGEVADNQQNCGLYLRSFAETITNEDHQIVDILIHIAVPSNVSLPPDSRYRVTVKDNLGRPRDIVTDDTTVSLTMAGLFPHAIDNSFEWNVGIEYLAGQGGDLFLPYCLADEVYSFDFEIEAEKSQTSVSPTFTPIFTPTRVIPSVTPLPPTQIPSPTSIPDTIGPKISNVNNNPDPIFTHASTTVTVTASDLAGIADITLYFKLNKSSYQVFGAMTEGRNDRYSVDFGPLTIAGVYSYRIVAVDSLGNPNCSTGDLESCPGGSVTVIIP